MAAAATQNLLRTQLLSNGFIPMQTKTGEALVLTYQLEIDREFLLRTIQFITTAGGKLATFTTNTENSLTVALATHRWIIVKGDYVSLGIDSPISRDIPPEDVTEEMTDYYTGCLVDQPVRCKEKHVLEQSRVPGLNQDGQNGGWVNVSPNCPHTCNGLHRIADNHNIDTLEIDRGIRSAVALFRRMDQYRRHLDTVTADLQRARAALDTSIALANATNAQLTIAIRERDDARTALEQKDLLGKLTRNYQNSGMQFDHKTKTANIAVQAAAGAAKIATTPKGQEYAGKLLGKFFTTAAKNGAKKGAERMCKFLPGVGFCISAREGWHHFQKGNYIRATGAVVAGGAGLFPGAGSLVSIAIDGVFLLDDLSNMNATGTPDVDWAYGALGIEPDPKITKEAIDSAFRNARGAIYAGNLRDGEERQLATVLDLRVQAARSALYSHRGLGEVNPAEVLS